MDAKGKPRGGSESIQDAREALRIIEHQSGRVDRVFRVLDWAFCVIWGIDWLVAYGMLSVGIRMGGGKMPAWAFAVFGGVLLVGITASIVVGVSTRRGYQSGAGEMRMGAIYGWTWCLSFGLGMSSLGVAVGRLGLSDNAAAVLYNIVVPLITGTLYMAGAAIWRDLSQLIVGVWMLVLAFAAAFLSGVMGYAMLSLLGGGAMLLMGVWALVFGRRNKTFAALMQGSRQ